jgi:glycosyltransferase involved in cell wall biosynthesis
LQQLVSIIIPTYNRAHLLGVTIDSILQQTYSNLECILVDDGSSDYTEELLEFYCARDNRVKYYKRPGSMTKGANSCRNYGFEVSNGDYVNWFDSDDVMLPKLVEEQLNNFQKDTQFSICSGYYTDENLNIDRKLTFSESENLYKNLVLWRNHIITNCVLFRKIFLQDKELFKIEIQRGQEMELFSRLFFKIPKKDYRVINRPLFLYREHPHTITEANKSYNKVYVKSQSYTALENLNKGIQLNDIEIINVCYSKLINFFFRGFENEHPENSVYILKRLVPLLWKFDRKLGIEFLFYGSLLVTLKRGSYSIERKFRYSL